MSNSETNYNETTPCEGSTELNGKDSSFRGAKMVSDARIVRKMRVGGALVPMPREEW
jgi:hypothetical protein